MLKTEVRNERTTHIDKMAIADMVRVMQDENINAAMSIEGALGSIEKAIDAISKRMAKGGRLFYVGCGTSGRLGVLDASECPPTYGVPHGLVVGIIAGGESAIRKAVEGAEDSREAGYSDISEYDISELDSVVGISVAGGAHYVIGAFDKAREVGALRISLSSNENTPIERAADIAIITDTGAEVVTGSTRMKAGSAHKMVLNMISTAVMVKLGHVYENMMINLRPSNIKLRDRMIRILREITELPYDECEKLLEENEFSLKKALKSIENK
ncbi:MAG: N-acetylmuramic acid 6-phosphate etherase [Ruminococcaceae bacterium]|nr:N-acetylmuramic acid 6-phosphate etherase [Oscillospiraceae bacterium]